MSTYDLVAKVQPAKLLVANVQETGCFGRFLAQLSVEDENGNKHRVVREVSVRDSLAKLSTADLLVGWTISELALAMGAAESDDRLRRRTRRMSKACAKPSPDVQTFRGLSRR